MHRKSLGRPRRLPWHWLWGGCCRETCRWSWGPALRWTQGQSAAGRWAHSVEGRTRCTQCQCQEFTVEAGQGNLHSGLKYWSSRLRALYGNSHSNYPFLAQNSQAIPSLNGEINVHCLSLVDKHVEKLCLLGWDKNATFSWGTIVAYEEDICQFIPWGPSPLHHHHRRLRGIHSGPPYT